MTAPVRLLRCGALLLLLWGCGGPARTSRPSASLSSGMPFRALVIQCIPQGLPRAFVAERGAEEAARGMFEDTRRTVLTTLGLFLGTGRWAGEGARIGPNLEPPLPGTDEECRALRRVVAGREVLPLPGSPDWVAGKTAVVGIVDYDYVPAQVPGAGEARTIPPRLLLRLAVVFLQDGKVLGAAPAETGADYARVSQGYQERTSQEVAQSLTERLAASLKEAMVQVLR